MCRCLIMLFEMRSGMCMRAELDSYDEPSWRVQNGDVGEDWMEYEDCLRDV